MSAARETAQPTRFPRAVAHYAKLKPGPGRSAEEVAASQCARLRAAMVELVGERGYDAVGVCDLTQRAGVSTRSFYGCFKGKQECLLDAYDAIMRRAARRLAAAQEGESDWRRRLETTFEYVLGEIVAEPRAACFAFVEAPAAGFAILERMRVAQAAFEATVSASLANASDEAPVSPLLAKGIVAGVVRVARMRILAGGGRELPDLVDELLEWALCFRSEAARECGRSCRLPVNAGGRSWSVAGTPVPEVGLLESDERKLILVAAARLAAKDGYWRLSAPRIRRAACVSRRSFDAHFEDVRDCFLALFDLLAEYVIEILEREEQRGGSRPGAIHRTLATLCAGAAREPALARLAFVEAFAPGPEAIRHRERVLETLGGRIYAGAPARQVPSAAAADASIGAAWGIVQHYVAEGRAQRLPQLVPLLSFLVLAPEVGPEAAMDAIRGEGPRLEPAGTAISNATAAPC